MGIAATSWRLFREKRRRLLPLLVVVAVLVMGSRLAGAVPREVSMRYELAPRYGTLEEARIGYRLDGEEVKAVRFAYAEGAPSVVHHEVTLSPGHYEIVADVVHEGVASRFIRTLEVPADGVVRVRLDEAPTGASR
jgi:hypothetical protein